MVGEVKLSITRSWVQNLSLPDERSNRETSLRIGVYSVSSCMKKLVMMQKLEARTEGLKPIKIGDVNSVDKLLHNNADSLWCINRGVVVKTRGRRTKGPLII